jgi:hypothetical protein
MIRVPTPLVDAVRELARLHRQGRTKAVLEGVQQLIEAIDSEIDINTDSISESISRLMERLDRLEAQQSDSSIDINLDRFTFVVTNLDQRLEKVEDDVKSIALTIADLNVRVSDLEGLGDIGYAVTPLSELELSGDISADSEVSSWQQDQDDITADVEQIPELAESDAINGDSESTAEAESLADIVADSGTTAEPESPPQPQAPLTQIALATRLGVSDKSIQRLRQKGKESFAEWSRDRDPDDIAWTWEGAGGRGQPLQFVPLG